MPATTFAGTMSGERVAANKRTYSEYQSTIGRYLLFPLDRHFLPHLLKLEALESKADTQSEDAAPPSAEAIRLAKTVLQSLQYDGIVPTRIVSSAEGGVAICFTNHNKYADIECLNSGEMLGVLANRHDRPSVWEIRPVPDDIARASAKIGQFISSR